MIKIKSIFYTTGIISPFLVGWWYRPISIDESNKSKRSGLMSKYGLPELADIHPPFLYEVGRKIVIFFQVSLSRIFLMYGGSFKLKEDDKYLKFLSYLKKRDSPMITVSNHRSLLDDPLIFSCLTPFLLNIQPKFLRYNLCSQEYCFNEKVYLF